MEQTRKLVLTNTVFYMFELSTQFKIDYSFWVTDYVLMLNSNRAIPECIELMMNKVSCVIQGYTIHTNTIIIILLDSK